MSILTNSKIETEYVNCVFQILAAGKERKKNPKGRAQNQNFFPILMKNYLFWVFFNRYIKFELKHVYDSKVVKKDLVMADHYNTRNKWEIETKIAYLRESLMYIV